MPMMLLSQATLTRFATFSRRNNLILTLEIQWSNSIHLTKDASGFETKVRIPWGTKVEYKFLVDGVWKTRDDMPIERDPSGKYINNAYTAPSKPASTVSSAIAYVASGIGGALSTIAGIDSGKVSFQL